MWKFKECSQLVAYLYTPKHMNCWYLNGKLEKLKAVMSPYKSVFIMQVEQFWISYFKKRKYRRHINGIFAFSIAGIQNCSWLSTICINKFRKLLAYQIRGF